jgi:succinate dehydrogenase / fumarate reductase iron-sulfur subunit
VKKLAKTINVTLKVWRQPGSEAKGHFETIATENISVHMSFIEMLDMVNEQLTLDGKDPIAFDNDCREGICGTCGAVVDGQAHGPQKATTLCQLHMRQFSDGDTIVVEPFRARAFKVVKDLVVDRSPFDKIIQAGGYISVNTGGAPDGNAIPIPQEIAEKAMDAAACIGCGACVAACPSASAMLFVSGTSWPCCPRANRKPPDVRSAWLKQWIRAVSATAATIANARTRAPKSCLSSILRG